MSSRPKSPSDDQSHSDRDPSSLLTRRAMVGSGITLGAGVLGASLFSGKGLAQQSEDGTPVPEVNTRQAPATPAPLGSAIPPELSGASTDWPTAQGNLQATRAAA